MNVLLLFFKQGFLSYYSIIQLKSSVRVFKVPLEESVSQNCDLGLSFDFIYKKKRVTFGKFFKYFFLHNIK